MSYLLAAATQNALKSPLKRDYKPLSSLTPAIKQFQERVTNQKKSCSKVILTGGAQWHWSIEPETRERSSPDKVSPFLTVLTPKKGSTWTSFEATRCVLSLRRALRSRLLDIVWALKWHLTYAFWEARWGGGATEHSSEWYIDVLTPFFMSFSFFVCLSKKSERG